jgi:hypothetical protein
MKLSLYVGVVTNKPKHKRINFNVKRLAQGMERISFLWRGKCAVIKR